ncbi:MAG TPA: MerR family transcriptional regulator [Caulobacteraceae bacterium]|jgi:DNA-binding transcriptional MerR regulator|nr:MerR family transcriptional regulator [Caulobacteraceae bacterium]
MARRLGVSPKALRVYERAGLVKPLRTAAGWRAYGPEQSARLHQVLALKGLGVPLRQIAELMHGRLASLDSVLELQQQALMARRAQDEVALTRIAAAREVVARSEPLSLDDLTRLTKETAMTKPLKIGDGEWGAAIKPLIEKHYTPEQRTLLIERGREAAKEAGNDQAAIGREWDAVFEEAHALQAAGDTTSTRARELARRWMRMANLFTDGDSDISERSQAFWGDAMADPQLGPRLPVTPELLRFVGKIMQTVVAEDGRASNPPAA